MATWVAGMGFSQAHRNRSTLDDVPDLVRVLVLKGLKMNARKSLVFMQKKLPSNLYLLSDEAANSQQQKKR